MFAAWYSYFYEFYKSLPFEKRKFSWRIDFEFINTMVVSRLTERERERERENKLFKN